MIIRKTQYQSSVQPGVVHELRDGYRAIDPAGPEFQIRAADGSLELDGKGAYLDGTPEGDAVWLDQGAVHRWTPEGGVKQIGRGYYGVAPGPDGTVFAVERDKEIAYGDTQGDEIHLLGAEGQQLGSVTLPSLFKVTGAYASRDHSEMLIAGTRKSTDPTTDYENSVYRVTVQDGRMGAKAIHRQDVHYLGHDDYTPLLLEDGRAVVFVEDKVRVGKVVAENSKQLFDALGPSAAPAGQSINLFREVTPALTLSEQLAQAAEKVGFRGLSHTAPEPPEGAAVWPLAELEKTELVPFPENSAADLEKSKSADNRAVASLALGGTAAALGAGLAMIGLGPIGIGVAAVGALAGGALKFLGNGKEQSLPRLRDPQLASKLKTEMLLDRLPSQNFPHADVTVQGNRALVSFPHTGMVLTKSGEGEDLQLRLYGPTGDEKELGAFESFELDADKGELRLGGTLYDLQAGSVENNWVSISDGVIKRFDSGAANTTATYLGGGNFETSQTVHRLPLPAEVFSDSLAVDQPKGAGEIFERSTPLQENTGGFRSLTKIETLKNPELAANETVGILEPELLSTRHRVVLADGRVLEGNAEGAKLNGKDLRATLILKNDGIELSSTVQDTYLGKVAKNTVGSTLLSLISPGYQATEDRVLDFESHTITQTLKPNGEMEVFRTARLEQRPDSPYQVVDRFLIRADGQVENLPIEGATRSEKAQVDGKGHLKTGVAAYGHYMTSKEIRLPVPPG